jgi:hypothetical protein
MIGLAKEGASMELGSLTEALLGKIGCTIKLGEYDLMT